MALIQLLSLVLLVSFSYKAISVILQKKLRAELTALDDIPLLSEPRRGGRKMQGTAVICGGSIAGLLSARVCSTHFEKVVIIEPEEWVGGEDGVRDRHRAISTTEHPVPKRSHVAQYAALHSFQTFLYLALQKLFPNLESEVDQEGVGRIVPHGFKTHVSGVRIPNPHHHYPNGILPKGLVITRPALETTLRRMVLKTCPNVSYSLGNVIGLVRDKTSTNMISSVKVRSRSGVDEEISSTLVIDCTGPALGGLRWLKDLPLTTDMHISHNTLALEDLKITFDHKMAYTTCEFDVPSNIFEELKKHSGFPTNDDDLNLYVYVPNPKVESSNVIIQRRERNRVQIACGGWDCRERMASVSDIREFLSYKLIPARPVPAWVFIMLDLFEQEEVPATYGFSRCPPAVYVRYHLANDIPSNFAAVGDSVMQTNPLRGLGCTKACVEAVTLNGELARCVPVSLREEKGSRDALPQDFSRKFFAKLAKRTAHTWRSMKLSDYAFKSTTPISGEDKETTGSWSRAYSASVMRLSTMDADVAGVSYKISNWVAPATDMFSPVMLRKVAWMRIRNLFGF